MCDVVNGIQSTVTFFGSRILAENRISAKSSIATKIGPLASKGLLFFGMIAVALAPQFLFAQQATSPSDTGESIQVPDPVTAAGRPLTSQVPLVPAPRSSAVQDAEDKDADDVEPKIQVLSSDPSSRALQEVVLRAVDQLDGQRIPRFETAKVDLENAIFQVQNYVGIGTQKGQAWDSFLRMDEIREELAKDRPSFAKFAELEMNMRQNYVGLENVPFVNLRDSLNKVKRSLKYGSDPDRTIRVITTRMEALVDSLNEVAPSGSGAKRAEDVGRIANYLYEAEQTPWLLTELRQRFSAPNVQVYARESLLNRLLFRSVARPSPVNECILGTRILGQACLRGSVSADVLPMHGGVALNLNLSGHLSSNNRGYNRGVVLRTTGSSPVFASKQIVVTPNGISSSPASVATNLMTSINAIEHRFRIVRRIAKKKAGQQKAQADAIAQGRMQTKLRTQYDQQVEEQLTEARGQLSKVKQQAQSSPEFRRLEIPRLTPAVYSTNNTVNADVVQAASYQLAASKPCSIIRPGSSEIVVEVHQSVAINTLETLLADRTIRHHDLDDFAKQILGEVPEGFADELDTDPWTITMVAFNPVQIDFDEDKIKLTLRFARMEGNERDINGAIVSVMYRPSYSRGILTLRREGDLEIELPTVRSANQATVLRSAVRKKLDPIFKEEIQTEKIDLTERFPNAPTLVVDWIKIDDGWLQVGLR